MAVLTTEIEMPAKRCSRCNLTRPLSEFTRNKQSRDGLGYYCRSCTRERNNRYLRSLTDAQKERRRQTNARSFQKNRERYREGNKQRTREWYASGRGKALTRSRSLEKRYGLTVEQVEEMLAEQNGVCAICSQPESRQRQGVTMSLTVDHDAGTGRIRGMLCSRCNVAIGMMAHDGDRLAAAIAYLKKGAR